MREQLQILIYLNRPIYKRRPPILIGHLVRYSVHRDVRYRLPKLFHTLFPSLCPFPPTPFLCLIVSFSFFLSHYFIIIY